MQSERICVYEPSGNGYGSMKSRSFESDACMPGKFCEKDIHALSYEESNNDGDSDDDGDGDDGMDQLDATVWPENLGHSLLHPTPFNSWVHQFVRQVLAARTRFSYFVMRTISASRSGRNDITATALFPIPFPFEEAFVDGPDFSSKKKRRTKALQKLMHLAVMALNYEHVKSPMTILQLIRRRPGPLHKAVFSRIKMFFEACGPPASISVAGCGRKKFQLDARHKELVVALASCGLNPTSLYHRGASGCKVPVDNDAAEELRPYRPLCADRIVLSGSGNWDCEEFLSDLLYMHFVEPSILRFHVIPPPGSFPDAARVDHEQSFRLCKVWDARRLLRLIPRSLGPRDDELFLHTKVFGNYKNKDVDRQIGDRRGRNFVEGRIAEGPSHEIPNATAILQLEVKRRKEVLVGAVADRRDFYHQFATSYERSATNTILPPFRLKDFAGFYAYAQFQEDFGQKRRPQRETAGDFLGMPKPLLVQCDDDTPVLASFGALFQGDHLGVEFACCAHASMLEEAGCHPWHNRLCANQPILHNKPVTGLVIDDFFVLSSEDICFARGSSYIGGSSSKVWLQKAKEAYKVQGVLGSDDKEVSDSLCFKIIGAEVNSSEEMAKEGIVAVGSPAEKRFGLMMLSACAASLPYTSDALLSSLVGSWISVLLYRRPMMAHINKLFQVIPAQELDPDEPVLWPLSRGAAEELLALVCLAPLAASNIAVPFSDQIYASDASTLKGGLVSATVSEELSRMLWRTSLKKAKNPKLQSRTAALHRIHDAHFEEEDVFEEREEEGEEVSRPIGLYFDFIELCGGAGVVSRELVRLGCVCGPVFDISYSKRYDITDKRVFAWIAFMCEEGRLKSFLAAPPCTTFSPAAHPCLRTYKLPLGIDPSHPRVVHGNAMAFSCGGLLMVAKRTRTPGMMETPRRSKLRWTPQWKQLKSLGADEVLLASCEYGSPHQKEFAFLTVAMNARSLARKCSRTHKRITIEGRYTKPSATYCEGLARALALVFVKHIEAISESATEGAKVQGLEDVLSNEVLLSSSWQPRASWKWRGSSHINILEAAAALRAHEAEALRGGDFRFVSFIDSNVALCAITRGRSSSNALRHLLKRSSTLSLACVLHHAGRYAPTRLNPADHPTRDTEIPPALEPALSLLRDEELRWLSSLSGMRRWASNWLRLSLLLCPSWTVFFTEHSCLRRYGPETRCFTPPWTSMPPLGFRVRDQWLSF